MEVVAMTGSRQEDNPNDIQIEALRTAKEELANADEELRLQNAELSASREELERTNARYRDLFEGAPDGYIVTDPEGKILEANQAAARLLGCTTISLAQRQLSDLLPAIRIKGFCRRRSTSSQSRWEGTVFPISGEPFWASMTAAASYDEDGIPVNLRWLIRDITDRKKIEEALRESESHSTALASQLRELASELTLSEQRERHRIAKALHDHIQQLLVAAKLQTSTLLNRQADEDLAATAKLVYEMLGQTLAATRALTAELSPPILHDMGLGPALQWLARNFLEKHELKVEISFDPSGEPHDENVRVFLFDAIREILSNVVKHSGVKEARLECYRGKDERLRVIVSDKGVGFDRENLEYSEPQGFGFFSIQQRLHHMGGSLEIETAPGQGARITLIGPAPPRIERDADALSKQSQAGVPAEEASSAGKIRVVLADDHNIVRQGLVSILRMERDIEVVGEASNGAQAVNMARSLHPDVVVMDVSMPVLNGIEATIEIHRDMPDIKIIGLSMHEEGELSSAIRQAGAVGYVIKAGSPKALVTAIHKAVG